jgi:hypothetical protein
MDKVEQGDTVEVYVNLKTLGKQAKKLHVGATWLNAALSFIQDRVYPYQNKIVVAHIACDVCLDRGIRIFRYRGSGKTKNEETARLLYTVCSRDQLGQAGKLICVHIIKLYNKNEQDDTFRNYANHISLRSCCED